MLLVKEERRLLQVRPICVLSITIMVLMITFDIAVQKIVDALDDEYGGQLTVKEQELQSVQDELNAITQELESTRKGLEERQAQSQKLSEAQQKTKNIESALEQGWYHLEEILKKAGKAIPDPSAYESIDENEDVDASFTAPELSIPENATEEEKKELLEDYVKNVQAKVKGYTINDQELQKEIKELEDQFVEKEMQCKRLIAACCNLPIDKIDDLVEPLTLAIESDPPDLDLARVIGFMDKIRRQGAFAEPATPSVPSTSPGAVPAPASQSNTNDAPIASPAPQATTEATTTGATDVKVDSEGIEDTNTPTVVADENDAISITDMDIDHPSTEFESVSTKIESIEVAETARESEPPVAGTSTDNDVTMTSA
jgi:hypothetical protein